MLYTRRKSKLEVTLDGDFNLNTVRRISELMGDKEELLVDLTRSRFVNSNAIMYLNNLIRGNKIVRLKNPPKIFFETLQLLGLHEAWNLKEIVEP
jgi:anti-anti-sigma regulatory factor